MTAIQTAMKTSAAAQHRPPGRGDAALTPVGRGAADEVGQACAPLPRAVRDGPGRGRRRACPVATGQLRQRHRGVAGDAADPERGASRTALKLPLDPGLQGGLHSVATATRRPGERPLPRAGRARRPMSPTRFRRRSPRQRRLVERRLGASRSAASHSSTASPDRSSRASTPQAPPVEMIHRRVRSPIDRPLMMSRRRPGRLRSRPLAWSNSRAPPTDTLGLPRGSPLDAPGLPLPDTGRPDITSASNNQPRTCSHADSPHVNCQLSTVELGSLVAEGERPA